MCVSEAQRRWLSVLIASLGHIFIFSYRAICYNVLSQMYTQLCTHIRRQIGDDLRPCLKKLGEEAKIPNFDLWPLCFQVYSKLWVCGHQAQTAGSLDG